MVTLPCRNDLTHYAFQCELDGSTYGFEFRWNDRDSAWYLALSDADGTPLASTKVALGPPLLWRLSDTRLPPGRLLVYDTTGAGEDAGLTDLGARVHLNYYTRAELDAL